ncbi:YciC family protein [Brevundimonas subvibrioides]|uniref:YciC family protein n=1 Tax=Brevundimonas subvibrioides TaxID=74313 RepID=UPI0022B2EF72|nr:YciC family protein [Brevundimonas subvibrioides]
MATTDYNGGGLDLGRVTQRTFASISQNWLVFLGSSLFLIGVPSAISALGQGSNIITERSPLILTAIVVGGILTLVGTYILQGLVVFVTVNGFNGKRIGLGQALSAGLRYFFPLLGLGILMGLGLMVGFILLVIPGIILSIMWIVAAPALVAERRGVMESFQRSRDLTRGSRWMIFAIVVVYTLVAWLLSMAVAGVMLASSGSLTPTAGATPSIAVVIVTPIVNVVTAILSSAGIAAIYYELRTVKEGVAPEALASVFD